MLSGLFKFLIPATKTAVKAVARSGTARSIAKSLGREAKSAAANIASDVLEGKTVKESAQSSLNKARANIAKQIKRTALAEADDAPSPRQHSLKRKRRRNPAKGIDQKRRKKNKSFASSGSLF